MTEQRRGIAVVGGGPAGLAAAWRLAEAGHGVQLYEASSRVGGGLRTDVVAGRGADVAVQLLSAGYTATLGLLDAMGLADRIVPAPGKDALWRDGRAHPLRYGSVMSMAASGALPAGLKVRLGLRYAPFLERRAASLDLNDPGAAGRLHGTTIAEWGADEMGEPFVEWLAYPLLSAYYGVAPEETSAGFFHALARSGMGVEVVGARGGFGALAEAMAAALTVHEVEVRTGAPVRELAPTAGGVRVVTDAGSAEHDAVVVALPPRVAAALLPLPLIQRLPLLEEIRTRSTVMLVLATRSPIATGWFGLSIPRTEPAGATLAAVCVQAEKGTGVVGPEGGSLVVVPAPGVGERWAEAETREVLAEAMAALRDVLPVADNVLEARVVRLEDAVWLPDPDHFARLPAFRQESLPPWLSLAGDYLIAPTVEGAVRSGLAAADRAALSVGSG